MKTQLLQDIDDSHPTTPPLPPHAEAPPVEARPTRTSSFAEQWRQAGLSPSKHVPVFDTAPIHQRAPASEPEPVKAPAFKFEGIAQLESGPGWFDRWGRRAATWSLGLAAAVLLAGAGIWVYNESKLERTLAAVAKSSPQVAQVKPAPAVQALPPLPATASAGPQLVMLNTPESAGKADALAPVAAASPPRKAKRERALPKPVPAAAPQETERASQLALTLRQCRIEGYHAQQCMKRACVLTRYGLACRG